MNKILAALGMDGGAGESWLENWPLSEPSFTPENLFFLNADYVADACRTLKIHDEVAQAFQETLPAFKNNPALQRLAWHCHYLLFQSSKDHAANIGSWPLVPKVDMFYAIVFLSGLRHVMEIHRKLGIPEAITLDTLSDLQLWIYENRKRHGAWGFKEKSWLVHHFLGKLFKLGRLQFLPGAFTHDFHVFRHNATGKKTILAGENMSFRRDGQFDGADKIFGAEGKWTAKFGINDNHACGYPVSPYGKAMPEAIKLPLSDWREILKKNSPVLTIHIPATGPLLHPDCGASLKQALEFYPKYFPEYKFNAFTCESWLLDGQFERQIPPSSNIVRFLMEFYLYPLPNADGKQTFERVFGKQIENIKDAPQNTSLQRTVANYVLNGGHWRVGGGMLFPDDLKWGEQTYRKTV